MIYISKLLIIFCYFFSSSLFAINCRTAQEIVGSFVRPTIIELDNGNEVEVFRIKNIVSRNILGIPSTEEGGYVGKNVMLMGRRSGKYILLNNAYVGANTIILGHSHISKNVHISGNARVSGNVHLSGTAHISGNVYLSGNVHISGNANLSGNVKISDNAKITGNANISDNARISGNAIVWGNARVYENAKIRGNAEIYDGACVFGNAVVTWDSKVFGFAQVYDDAVVSGNAHISWDEQELRYAQISGDIHIYENIDENYSETNDFDQVYCELNEKCKVDECTICLEEFDIYCEEKFCKLHNCEHVFHVKCLKQWCKNNKTCPICRADMKNESN